MIKVNTISNIYEKRNRHWIDIHIEKDGIQETIQLVKRVQEKKWSLQPTLMILSEKEFDYIKSYLTRGRK